ncbi:alpha/beta fold hydrolase [Marisediminicola sp. LYQ85]|uniref:alpha/beta fold hydrolase n=1 Tax=Marisediminicola sp. LYQ85 TaxID=3391062 RepID=UPI0039832180
MRPRKSSSSTTVEVRRVYSETGDVYARVNTVGHMGDRAFVLVPGIGVSSTYFERLAPNLNEFGPVHALDLPGFGGVPHPGKAMSIRQYADLLGRVIDELGLVDPVIVGHSMGTQVVSDLVARRDDITTLVLIGPVVDPGHRHIPSMAVRFLRCALKEPFAVKFLAVSAYLLCGFKWFSRILPRMMRYPIEDRFADIRARTLVIRGEHDYVSPRDWVERIGDLLPDSHLWEIPDAAHSVMHAHAEEVAVLCVEHARDTLKNHDRPGVNVYPEHELLDNDLEPTAGDIVESIKGRVTDTIGTIRGDDEMIAEGKTRHARAMDAAAKRADAASAADAEAAAQKSDGD